MSVIFQPLPLSPRHRAKRLFAVDNNNVKKSKNDYWCAQGGIAPLSQAAACSHSLLAPRELS